MAIGLYLYYYFNENISTIWNHKFIYEFVDDYYIIEATCCETRVRPTYNSERIYLWWNVCGTRTHIYARNTWMSNHSRNPESNPSLPLPLSLFYFSSLRPFHTSGERGRSNHESGAHVNGRTRTLWLFRSASSRSRSWIIFIARIVVSMQRPFIRNNKWTYNLFLPAIHLKI